MITASRALVLGLLFLSFSATASLTWPKGMYTSGGIVSGMFREFNRYFSQVQRQYPTEWKGDNSFFIWEDRKATLRVYGRDLGTLADWQRFHVSFSSDQGFKRSIIIKVKGASEKLNLKTVLLGNPVIRHEEYSVDFVEQEFSFHRDRSIDGVKTVFEKGSGSVRVVLFESESPGELYSELFFNCDACSGNPLIAKASERNGLEVTRYYLGGDTRPVASSEFFKEANSFYIPWIFMQVGYVVSDGVDFAGWPAVE